MGALSLEIFKARLEQALGSLILVLDLVVGTPAHGRELHLIGL